MRLILIRYKRLANRMNRLLAKHLIQGMSSPIRIHPNLHNYYIADFPGVESDCLHENNHNSIPEILAAKRLIAFGFICPKRT